MQSNEQVLDHEVRIRLLEEAFKKIDARFEAIDRRFDKLDALMHSNFHWVLGTILVTFGGVLLHLAKLI